MPLPPSSPPWPPTSKGEGPPRSEGSVLGSSKEDSYKASWRMLTILSGEEGARGHILISSISSETKPKSRGCQEPGEAPPSRSNSWCARQCRNIWKYDDSASEGSMVANLALKALEALVVHFDSRTFLSHG